MHNSQKNIFGFFTVFVVVFGLFCRWVLFSFTGAGHQAETRMSRIMPKWLIVTNFLFLPGITVIATGPLRIRMTVRFVLGIVMLCSVVILEVSFRKLPVESCAVLAVFLLEVYWIVPKWNARRRRATETGSA